MANVRTVKRGDVLKCDVLGEVFFAEATGEPEKVSPRVYEIAIRRIGGNQFLVQQSRYKKVRGRQVVAVYRRLKS